VSGRVLLNSNRILPVDSATGAGVGDGARCLGGGRVGGGRLFGGAGDAGQSSVSGKNADLKYYGDGRHMRTVTNTGRWLVSHISHLRAY
jgi:hypothetical protein